MAGSPRPRSLSGLSHRGGEMARRRLTDMTLDLAAVYRDLHANPELSFQEHRTAGIVAEAPRPTRPRRDHGHRPDRRRRRARERRRTDRAAARRHGRPARARGDRPRLREHRARHGRRRQRRAGHARLRARRARHLPARRGRAARRPAATRGPARWSPLFQPAEEWGGGAQAMVDDALFEPRPDARTWCSASTSRRSPPGSSAVHAGVAMAAADSITVRLHGDGRPRLPARDHGRPRATSPRRDRAAAEHRLARDRSDRCRGA